MSAALQVSIGFVLLMLGFCLGALVTATAHEAETDRLVRETHQEGFEEGQRAALSRVSDAMPDARYEVVLTDWGLLHGEMRWRWTVWEADREVDREIFEFDPHDSPGTFEPYMLGNAPTRAMAEAEALAWVAAHPLEGKPSEDRFVVGA